MLTCPLLTVPPNSAGDAIGLLRDRTCRIADAHGRLLRVDTADGLHGIGICLRTAKSGSSWSRNHRQEAAVRGVS